MTRAETSSLMAIIAEEHSAFLKTSNPELRLDMWAAALENVPIEIAKFAVNRLLLESPYPPKLADIAQRVREIANANGVTAIDAWNQLAKATSRASVVTAQEFEVLPPEVRRFCGDISGLRAFGQLGEDTFNTVTRGQFMKVYDGMKRSRETVEMLPENVRRLVGAVAEAKRALPQGDNAKQSVTENEDEHDPAKQEALSLPVRPLLTAPTVESVPYETPSEEDWEKMREDKLRRLAAADFEQRRGTS